MCLLLYFIVLDCKEEEINRIQSLASPSQSDPHKQQRWHAVLLFPSTVYMVYITGLFLGFDSP